MNREKLKKIMSEKKATVPSLRNKDWKTVKVEMETINKILTHISGLKELIYAAVKLFCEKIVVSRKIMNTDSKSGWEIRRETPIRNLW